MNSFANTCSFVFVCVRLRDPARCGHLFTNTLCSRTVRERSRTFTNNSNRRSLPRPALPPHSPVTPSVRLPVRRAHTQAHACVGPCSLARCAPQCISVRSLLWPATLDSNHGLFFFLLSLSSGRPRFLRSVLVLKELVAFRAGRAVVDRHARAGLARRFGRTARPQGADLSPMGLP